MTDSITKVSSNKPPMGGLRKGIMANKESFDKKMAETKPEEVPNRLGIVLDDSGSMGTDGMENAHKAVRGFTNSCNMLDTSIAVVPLNKASQPLTCNYDLLNMYVSSIHATGGTPIYRKLDEMITNVKITRGVLFSDGDPTDSSILADEKKTETNNDFWYGHRTSAQAKEVLQKYVAKEIPIDTIYIGIEESSGYKEMKRIAEITNGTFIHFKDTNSLSTGLKYLAPKYRALLANPDIKKRIEAGENV